MNTVEILNHKSKTFKFTIPNNFDECDFKQITRLALRMDKLFEHIASMNSLNDKAEMSVKLEKDDIFQRERIVILMILANINPSNKFNAKTQLFFKLSDDQIHQLLELTNWVLNLPSFENPLPFIPIKGRGRLYGPDQSLRTLVGDEFAYAQKLLAKIELELENKKRLILMQKLFLTLYRPASDVPIESVWSTGDVRESFNRFNIEARMDYVKEVPQRKLILVKFWFTCALKSFMKSHPEIFSHENKEKANSTSFGWLDVFRELAGKDNTKFHQITSTPMPDLLVMLKMMKRDADRIKASNP